MTSHTRFIARSAAAIIVALMINGCGESRDQAVASARADFAAGETNAATIRLRSVLQTEPQFAEARLLLGEILLASGDPAGAEKELRKAFESGSETDAVKPLLARALLELGEYQRVISDFPPQQIRSPAVQADVLVSQAYAQLFQGNLEAARQAIAEAFRANPEQPRAAAASALLAGVEGNFEAASLAIDTVLARQPKLSEALWAKAVIAQGRGDLPTAIQTLQTLTQVRPSDIAAHYAAIKLLWQTGRTDDARAQIARMKAAAPHHPRTEHVLALSAFHDKNLPEARDRVARALKFDPEFGPSLFLSGMINAELGNYELAEKHLSKVLEKNSGNLAARRVLIGVLLRTQRTERALALAQQMVLDAPEQPEVLSAAAAAYLQAGDAKAAKSLLEKVHAQGAQDAKGLTGLALARMASGDASHGVSALMEASAADESAIEADLLLVKYYVANREFDKALASLATMAAKRPEEARIVLLEGEVLFGAGRKAEARAAFERAYELQPENLIPLRLLARLDLADGRPERAQKRFEDAIAKRPQEPKLLLAYSEWLSESKAAPETVRATIEKAIAIAPNEVSARLAIVAFYAQRQEVERALAAANEAATAIPGNERLLTALAEVQSRAGKPELAAVTLSKAIQLAPGSPELLVLLADAQQATGSVDDARASLLRALTLRQGFRPATTRLVALEQRAGNSGKALEVARELQKAQPAEAAGYALEAQVFTGQGQWPEAMRVLKSGIERTKAPSLVIALHQVLARAGRADEAARLGSDWLKTHPSDGVVRSYLAETALQARDYPAAVRAFQDIVAQSPNNVRALNNLAFAANLAGDPRAFEYAKRAYRLAPDDPNVLDTLGWIFVERGDSVRGIELLRQASAAAPNAPNLRLNLAKALLKTGDKTGARGQLEVLAKLGDSYPGQDEVRKLLAGL